jgi:streptomycin 6-kinase
MLKLRCDHDLIADEYAALCYWAATGSVAHLLAADVGRGALLLERLEPLDFCPIAGDQVAALLAALHRPQQGEPPQFQPLRRLTPTSGPRRSGVRHAASETWLALRLARLAGDAINGYAAAAARVMQRSTADRVIHGDFGPNNVLRRGAKLVAIDPKPRIGQPAYDVAVWCVRSLASGRTPALDLSIAAHLDIDDEELRDWLLVVACDELARHLRTGLPGAPVHELTELVRALASGAKNGSTTAAIA